MGGIGSGRSPQNRLSTSYQQLTVRKLADAGALEVGTITTWNFVVQGQIVTQARISAESAGLRVRYSWWSASDGWQPSVWFLRFDRSDCHYGGTRPWLICPKPGCGRRMYILYGDRDIACRTCRRFSYPSQRVTPADRPLYRVQSIRQQLGGSVDISLPFPPKPVGMPSFTYTKLGLRALRAEREANAQFFEMFKDIPSRLPRPVSDTPGSLLIDEYVAEGDHDVEQD